MINVDKQQNNSGKRIIGKPFPKGVSGNPNGRPKGKTIKERVLAYLEEHPEDMKSFVEHFVKDNRDLAWQMLEGRPPQKTDITSMDEKLDLGIVILPKKNEV